jgi:hypothetical protein
VIEAKDEDDAIQKSGDILERQVNDMGVNDCVFGIEVEETEEEITYEVDDDDA